MFTPAPLGSIPACAGDPDGAVARLMLKEVYPRVCGGSLSILPIISVTGGLSPRVRGIPR